MGQDKIICDILCRGHKAPCCWQCSRLKECSQDHDSENINHLTRVLKDCIKKQCKHFVLMPQWVKDLLLIEQL